MKSISVITIILLMASIHLGFSQENNYHHHRYWQIGIGLGELPTGGSFKPSITFGYHFNEKIYAGFVYQFKDRISRDGASFNAQSSGLEGLAHSSEAVAQRFLLQMRYTPLKNGPYLSGGLVFNGKDTETMQFDARSREINGATYDGTIEIQQTRPAGWGLALGIGYQHNFKNGFSGGFEWTPAWGQYPTPSYVFAGSSDLSDEVQEAQERKMNKGFRSSVTNMYKVFHIGIAYRFRAN